MVKLRFRDEGAPVHAAIWALLVIELAQGAVSVSAKPPGSPSIPPLRTSTPNSVDEIVVTAPKPGQVDEPKYKVVTGVRGRELDAEAGRKAAFIRYRDNIHAPYPGLNCVFRGKTCPN